MAVRVVVVDDNTTDRLRLAQLLSYCENMEIISEDFNPELVIDTITKTKPDLIFISIEIHKLSCFQIIESFRAYGISPPVVYTSYHDKSAIKAIRYNAFDYLIKPLQLDELRETIQRFITVKYVPDKHETLPLNNLSHRELDVLKLIIKGNTSKQVSCQLNISVNTVNSHRAKLLKKCHARNVAELILKSSFISF